jgi:hypothetical protein
MPPANVGATGTIRYEAAVGSHPIDPWAGEANRERTEIKEEFEWVQKA